MIFLTDLSNVRAMKIILTHSDTGWSVSQPTQKSFHKARFLYKYIETQTRTVKFFFLKIFFLKKIRYRLSIHLRSFFFFLLLKILNLICFFFCMIKLKKIRY